MLYRILRNERQDQVSYVRATSLLEAIAFAKEWFGKSGEPYGAESWTGMMASDPNFILVTPEWRQHEEEMKRAPEWADLAKLGIEYEAINEPHAGPGINVRRKWKGHYMMLSPEGKFVDHTDRFSVKGVDDEAHVRARLLTQRALTRYHLDFWAGVMPTYQTITSFIEWCQENKIHLTDEMETLVSLDPLLLKYLEVDSRGLEQQRRMLLDEQRKLSEAVAKKQ